MPKVGTKEYPYTAEGVKQAKKAAKKTGKPMKNRNKGKGTKTADAY
jgi:hypothetical protein